MRKKEVRREGRKGRQRVSRECNNSTEQKDLGEIFEQHFSD